MIKIDKGVPIPAVRKSNRKYPWPDMEEGDSFLHAGSEAEAKSAYTSGKEWCKRNRPEFTIKQRTTDEGVRLWMAKA